MENKTKIIGLSLAGVIIIISIILLGTLGIKEDVAQTIYKYKTEYVGDNSKVANIIINIPFANEYFKYKSIEIKSSEEPYMVVIKEDLKDGYSLKDISAQDLRNFADVMFATIKNLGGVRFEVYYMKDGQNLTATYTLKENEKSNFSYEMTKEEFEIEFNKIYLANEEKEEAKIKEQDEMANETN